MSKCAQQIASMVSIAADFDIALHAVVHSDSAAALGIAYRRGLGGKTRHVKVQYLWIQDAVANKELKIDKVNTLENPADMLTKFLPAEALTKHALNLGLDVRKGRSGYQKALDSLVLVEDVKQRMMTFAKHVGIAKELSRQLRGDQSS